MAVAAAPAARLLQADRPLLGIVLMLGFCALVPLGDAFAKLIGDGIPLGQVIALRFGFQTAVLVPLALLSGRSFVLSPQVLWLTALRTALHVVAVGAMYLALRFLPLAEAVAIAFVMPFILLLLGFLLLGETVGRHRLIACAAGFAGTLLVIQPSFADVGTAALLPLVVAVGFASFMLVTRSVAREADPIVLQAVSGAMAVLAVLPLAALANGRGWRELDWVTPGTADWALLLAIGLTGTVAHLLMTWSLRYAPTATLAPMQYLEIPAATLTGYLVFRDLPDGLAAAGILVTVGAGLYVIHRERRASSLPPRAAA